MIEVKLTPRVLDYAHAEAKALGLLKNSIAQGKGNLAGFIGDMIIADYIGATLEHTYDYDMTLGHILIDAKTKNTTVKPFPDYACSVSDFNTTQRCHWYAFARVDIPRKLGYILGYMPKELFYQRAGFLRKGSIEGSNKFVVKSDCYNINVNQLYDLPEKVECTS